VNYDLDRFIETYGMLNWHSNP